MPTSPLARLLAVARGAEPADLLLTHAKIVNLYTAALESADIAICGDQIAGIGAGYSAPQTIDLNGAYVAPGLIDAHVHIESSLCTPAGFESAVVPRGVTTVVTDPHEIANVAGIAGVRFMLDAARELSLSVKVMAPSCVPATPMGTSGAALDADTLAELLRDPAVIGLAEVMNFPGVIHADTQMLAKLATAEDRPIDGHAPSVTGAALNAYVAAGVGSDHECVTVDEAREKLARGLRILIREATNARNFEALIALVSPLTERRIAFCTDDRQPADLLDAGSVDDLLRRAIAFGVDPFIAFRLCTLNPAEWFNLADRGALAPGKRADLFTFADLKRPVANQVFIAGKLVAEDGKLTTAPHPFPIPPAVRGRCNVSLSRDDLIVRAASDRMRVIGSRRDQLITDHLLVEARAQDGIVVADVSQDLLKIAVIGRHGVAPRRGLGFIRGFGLKRGAIAGTVAHDHHNLVVIGADDASMLSAVQCLSQLGGGLVATVADQVLASLALPAAGLMSDLPIVEVRRAYDKLLAAAKSLGAGLSDPFMALSFMALEVIPSLKLTDQGLVDVEQFKLVSLFV